MRPPAGYQLRRTIRPSHDHVRLAFSGPASDYRKRLTHQRVVRRCDRDLFDAGVRQLRILLALVLRR